MPVIEAQCASILVPHDHRHINQKRVETMHFEGYPGSRCIITLSSGSRSTRGRRVGHPEAPSLGLIKPRTVDRLDIEPNEAFTEDKQRLAELAAADDLFKAQRSVLEPAPYRLKYHYYCMEDGCSGHHQTLIDWEAGQAARKGKPTANPTRSCQGCCGRNSSASYAPPPGTPTSSSATSTSTGAASSSSACSGRRLGAGRIRPCSARDAGLLVLGRGPAGSRLQAAGDSNLAPARSTAAQLGPLGDETSVHRAPTVLAAHLATP